MSARGETWLWLAQRATAALLAIAVAVHIAVIVYATDGGLTAAEILARTRGSLGWGAFYGVFVAAVSVHGAIGLRAVLREMTPLGGRGADLFALAFGLTAALLGARAVWAVVV